MNNRKSWLKRSRSVALTGFFISHASLATIPTLCDVAQGAQIEVVEPSKALMNATEGVARAITEMPDLTKVPLSALGKPITENMTPEDAAKYGAQVQRYNSAVLASISGLSQRSFAEA